MGGRKQVGVAKSRQKVVTVADDEDGDDADDVVDKPGPG